MLTVSRRRWKRRNHLARIPMLCWAMERIFQGLVSSHSGDRCNKRMEAAASLSLWGDDLKIMWSVPWQLHVETYWIVRGVFFCLMPQSALHHCSIAHHCNLHHSTANPLWLAFTPHYRFWMATCRVHPTFGSWNRLQPFHPANLNWMSGVTGWVEGWKKSLSLADK